MKRLLQIALLLAMVAVLAAPAAAGQISGTLNPGNKGDQAGGAYDYIISSQPIDAQDGLDVVIKAALNGFSEDRDLYVQVGLIPKGLRDQLVAGTIGNAWDQGVYAVTEWPGQFSVTAEDFEGQANAPQSLPMPVLSTGLINIRLQLTPKLAGNGGTAILKVNGHKTNMGAAQLSYGKAAGADPTRTEDYSAAYLITQVLKVGSGGDPVQVTASATQLPYSIRIKKIATYGPDMTARTTFHAGEAVILQANYVISSTKTKRTYEVGGELTFMHEAQTLGATHPAGKYGLSQGFVVPINAKPGKQKVTLTLELQYLGKTLYTEEAFKMITIE